MWKAQMYSVGFEPNLLYFWNKVDVIYGVINVCSQKLHYIQKLQSYIHKLQMIATLKLKGKCNNTASERLGAIKLF